MKKKTILSSSVFVASLLTASAVFAGGPEVLEIPDYFTGFYIGGTVAEHHATLKENSTVTSNAPSTRVLPIDTDVDDINAIAVAVPAGTLSTNTADGGSWDVFGGVVGGAGKVFNHRWYLGVVGFGEWGDQHDKATHTQNTNVFTSFLDTDSRTTPIRATVNSMTSTTSSTQTSLQNLYGGAAKFGYLITPRTMAFFKVGGAWSDLKVSNSVTVNNSTVVSADFRASNPVPFDVTTGTSFISGSSSKRDTKAAVFLGLGGEHIVWRDNISISLEYDYANFGTVKTNTTLDASTSFVRNDEGVITPGGNPSGPSNVSSSASGRGMVSNLYAAVNWYFNPGLF